MYIFEIAFNNKLGRELDRKSLCVYGQGQIPNGKMDIKVVGGVLQVGMILKMDVYF